MGRRGLVSTERGEVEWGRTDSDCKEEGRALQRRTNCFFFFELTHNSPRAGSSLGSLDSASECCSRRGMFLAEHAMSLWFCGARGGAGRGGSFPRVFPDAAAVLQLCIRFYRQTHYFSEPIAFCGRISLCSVAASPHCTALQAAPWPLAEPELELPAPPGRRGVPASRPPLECWGMCLRQQAYIYRQPMEP